MNSPAPYIRRVCYYETDRMGIVHHSNYIRWMEEARIDYMCLCGVDYVKIEESGVLMPVVSVGCTYKSSARFGDTVKIETRLESFNGVRAVFSYKIFLDGKNTLLAQGQSEHCFIDEQKRNPLNLKKRLPDSSKIMLEIVSGKAQ